MKREFKKKWIEWLLNPNNSQTYGALRKSDGYCCLGGLCEISGLGSWTSEQSDMSEYDGYIKFVLESNPQQFFHKVPGPVIDAVGAQSNITPRNAENEFDIVFNIELAPQDLKKKVHDFILVFTGSDSVVTAAAVNDTREFTFDEIATLVEHCISEED